jgi:uncharacterized membrane protein (DUF4010 family)
MDLKKQPSAAPSRKQNFNLLGSQLTTVGMVVFAIAAPEIYQRIPPDYAAGFGSAVAGLVGFGLGYLVRERG